MNETAIFPEIYVKTRSFAVIERIFGAIFVPHAGFSSYEEWSARIYCWKYSLLLLIAVTESIRGCFVALFLVG